MAVRLSLRDCFLDLDYSDEATRRSVPLTVHASIIFDLAQNTACFRMRVMLSQPPTGFSGPQGRWLYLDIPPEQLTSLSHCQLPDLPREIQQRPHSRQSPSIPTTNHPNNDCTRLTFRLDKPPVMIIPPGLDFGGISMHIHSEEDRQIFEALRSISKQSSLALVLYSTGLLSWITIAQLDALCSAASTGALKATHAFDPQRLYHGQGGTIVAPTKPLQYDNGAIDAEDVAGPAGSPPESPPSYEQVDSPPPLAPLSPQPRSMKRARTSTPSTESAGPVIDAQSLDFIIQRAISSAEARFQQELSRQRGAMAATEARLQEELRSQKDAMAATEARLQEELRMQKDAMAATKARLQQDLGREISTLREELVAHFDGKLVEYMTGPEMEAHLDEQLDLKSADLVTGAELEEHVNDLLDQQNEELVTRTEMEEFVEDRLETTSQRLRDRIFEAFDGQ